MQCLEPCPLVTAGSHGRFEAERKDKSKADYKEDMSKLEAVEQCSRYAIRRGELYAENFQRMLFAGIATALLCIQCFVTMHSAYAWQVKARTCPFGRCSLESKRYTAHHLGHHLHAQPLCTLLRSLMPRVRLAKVV